MDIAVPGLPELSWSHGPGRARLDSDDSLILTAARHTDWFNDPLGRPRPEPATTLGFDAPAQFALSAQVSVPHERSTFDAAVLTVRGDDDHWAKLCFEFSPRGEAMVVSVVTNEFSDDSNSSTVAGDSIFLRVCRIGPGWAFHSSADGRTWDFVRVFRLHDDGPLTAGFMAQAPTGDSCKARFDQIRYDRGVPTDLRDGS